MTLLNMLGCRNSFFCYQVSFFCDQVLERRNLLQPGLLKMNFNLREHKYKKADTDTTPWVKVLSQENKVVG